MFEDRHDAGEQLAVLVAECVPDADIVLAVPRGALPVARAVADRLGVPLDIVVAKKMGAPGNPEFAVGAAASDGTVWVDEALVDRYGIDDAYLDAERQRAAATARQNVETYRGDRDPPDLSGKTVVVVDDGVATGATARACLRQVQAAGASRVVLAVPVGAPDSLADLESEANEVLAVEAPARFGAVGAHYRKFGHVSDTEAKASLDWEAEP